MCRSPHRCGISLKRSDMLTGGVQFIKGIGPKKAEVLKKEAGIETMEDLLYYMPRRYLDRSDFRAIQDCSVNEVVTVSGTIRRCAIAGARRRFLEVVIDDGTASLHGVFFGGINYLQKILQPGETVLFSGKVDYYRHLQMVHPDFDFIDEHSKVQSINTGRIIPLYRSSEKLRSSGFDSRGFRRAIRNIIDQHLHEVKDPLDQALLARYTLQPLNEALFGLHFPETIEAAEAARRRLSFNELFFLQFYLALSRKHIEEESRPRKMKAYAAAVEQFIASLPFSLTKDQLHVIDEICEDLDRPHPMNRLLQGDVGSGKTVIAMASSLFALSRGQQVAVMAPTEVLAGQHYLNFSAMLPGTATTALLTGSIQKKEKTEIYRGIEDGSIGIVIGTHALIQGDVSFKDLGLIIIDEQHRFGVEQRGALRAKGENPDLLVMTATPIPRSLSLTLYGDMDSSYIREKPALRVPVNTIALGESRISGVFKSVRKYVSRGQQAYFVLPLIEESERIDLKSAVQTFEELRQEFPEFRIELLHGKMPPAEKEAIMHRFKNHEADILVSTTVIEVGVDVPNATVMVIMHAERFGLSQLHQLRGRVGRGELQSHCALVHPDDIGDDSKKRIGTIVSTSDGFQIAEEDLRLRGAGEITGTRQHGYSELEFADLARDIDLIVAAREEAKSAAASIHNVDASLKSLRDGVVHNTLLEGIRHRRILSILS